MKARCLLILSLLCFSAWAHAEQGCPPGFTLNASGNPGGPMCIPIPGYGTANNTAPPPVRAPRWKLTWGAIALDETTGDFGETVGHFSRGKAKRDALARCSRLGSKNCKLSLAYKNQCAVIAWASDNEKSVGGAAIVQGGPSIEVAAQIAIPACRTKRGGGECSIIYSNCTSPVLVQD